MKLGDALSFQAEVRFLRQLVKEVREEDEHNTEFASSNIRRKRGTRANKPR